MDSKGLCKLIAGPFHESFTTARVIALKTNEQQQQQKKTPTECMPDKFLANF